MLISGREAAREEIRAHQHKVLVEPELGAFAGVAAAPEVTPAQTVIPGAGGCRHTLCL